MKFIVQLLSLFKLLLQLKHLYSHRLAVKADAGKSQFKVAATKSYCHVKESIVSLMRIIYFKAQRLQSFDDLADEVELQIINVSILGFY